MKSQSYSITEKAADYLAKIVETVDPYFKHQDEHQVELSVPPGATYDA